MNRTDLRQRFAAYVSTVIAISFVAVVLVLFLSRLLERWIVRPLLDLSRTAQAVAARHDYSLRAHKQGADEVGALVEAFNQMLEETQRSQSERQRAAGQLRESEERLRLAQQVARIGTFEWNIQTGKNIWTPELEAIYGLIPGTFAGTQQTWENLVHPDDRERTTRHVAQAAETGAFAAEWRVIWPDGSIHWVAGRAFVFKDGSGKPLRLIGVNIDITERKRAEEELRESEAVLRTVTNEAQVGLVMVSKEHRYRFANQTYADILGLSDPNIVGRRIADVLPTLYDEQVKARLNRAFLGERVSYELHMPAHPRTGEERFYEVLYEPRTTGTDEPYVVVVIVDVTERKKAQQILEQTVEERTARLRETVGELEAFSYSIAHDMRAPLRSMVGFSAILSSEHGNKLDDSGRDYLRRIANSAERLDRLIQDVLNYSKVVRGELKLETIDTAKLIREIIESYPNLQPPNAEITIQDPLPKIHGNTASLTQVISNLLGNAVKFVPKGVHPRIVVRAETFGDSVRLWFEDNGIGIEPEAQKRLFQIFQRVHRPELYEGTGIGLAIVRKAVERMGGRVGVESQADKGSRFWVELKQAK